MRSIFFSQKQFNWSLGENIVTAPNPRVPNSKLWRGLRLFWYTFCVKAACLNWSFICPCEVNRWISVWIFSCWNWVFFLLPLTQRTEQNEQQQSSSSNFTSPKSFSVVKARLLLLFNTVVLNHKLYRLSSGKTELCCFPVLFCGFFSFLWQSRSVSGTVFGTLGASFSAHMCSCAVGRWWCVYYSGLPLDRGYEPSMYSIIYSFIILITLQGACTFWSVYFSSFHLFCMKLWHQSLTRHIHCCEVCIGTPLWGPTIWNWAYKWGWPLGHWLMVFHFCDWNLCVCRFH